LFLTLFKTIYYHLFKCAIYKYIEECLLFFKKWYKKPTY